jgi:hypothetical protein
MLHFRMKKSPPVLRSGRQAAAIQQADVNRYCCGIQRKFGAAGSGVATAVVRKCHPVSTWELSLVLTGPGVILLQTLSLSQQESFASYLNSQFFRITDT